MLEYISHYGERRARHELDTFYFDLYWLFFNCDKAVIHATNKDLLSGLGILRWQLLDSIELLEHDGLVTRLAPMMYVINSFFDDDEEIPYCHNGKIYPNGTDVATIKNIGKRGESKFAVSYSGEFFGSDKEDIPFIFGGTHECDRFAIRD